jgi:hypothetical protein
LPAGASQLGTHFTGQKYIYIYIFKGGRKYLSTNRHSYYFALPKLLDLGRQEELFNPNPKSGLHYHSQLQSICSRIFFRRNASLLESNMDRLLYWSRVHLAFGWDAHLCMPGSLALLTPLPLHPG